tara:strand:- start:700 stop:927 length:228 start_codon:yes stop_codon:yes gene_type:complete
MTDKAILDHVYRELLAGRVHQEMISFIEQEWQKRDEQEYAETVPSFSKKWYTDVRELERHRGLEIGPDGTVTEVK